MHACIHTYCYIHYSTMSTSHTLGMYAWYTLGMYACSRVLTYTLGALVYISESESESESESQSENIENWHYWSVAATHLSLWSDRGSITSASQNLNISIFHAHAHANFICPNQKRYIHTYIYTHNRSILSRNVAIPATTHTYTRTYTYTYTHTYTHTID